MAPKYTAGVQGSLQITCPCFFPHTVVFLVLFFLTSLCDVSVPNIKLPTNRLASKLNWSKSSHQQGQGKGLPDDVLETFVSSGNEYHELCRHI